MAKPRRTTPAPVSTEIVAPTKSKNKLPAALAKRATALAAQKVANLAAQGRAELAFIREKQREIVADFYDIGAALVRLNAPGVVAALGYVGLAELVERELSMSGAKARDLMGIAKLVRREDALRWGQEKSAALVELVTATAGADTPASLAQVRKLTLGTGRVIDVEHANASAIQEAAKEIRAARQSKGSAKRGVSASSDERRIAKDLEKALHALGETRALVVAVARPGKPADLRIERVAAGQLAKLARAAKGVRKPA